MPGINNINSNNNRNVLKLHVRTTGQRTQSTAPPLAGKQKLFMMMLDSLHDFDEGNRGKALMQEMKNYSKPKISSWKIIATTYKLVAKSRRSTIIRSSNIHKVINQYLEQYLVSGGNKALDLRVGLQMAQTLAPTNKNYNIVNILNVRPLALKRINNPSVTRVKLWAFYTIFSEYYKSINSSSLPPYVNKKLKNGTNNVQAKSFGMSADDVYKLCEKKGYNVCIDAMDTTPKVPFTDRSLLDFKVITVAQIFDAASLTGAGRTQFCYFKYDAMLVSSNEYKIFTDMFLGCKLQELLDTDAYVLCFQGTCEQIYLTFYYYILIPKTSIESYKVRASASPAIPILTQEIDDMIFIMVPTTKRRQTNGRSLDVFYTKSLIRCQLITKVALNNNLNLHGGIGINNSNKRYYMSEHKYALLYDYKGLGVDELCEVRQIFLSIPSPTPTQVNNIFIHAATIFDYKRALDKFQIDICKSFNNNEKIYFITHDYLAALFGILEGISVILVHHGVFYMLPKNAQSTKNISNKINNSNLATVFEQLSNLVNLQGSFNINLNTNHNNSYLGRQYVYNSQNVDANLPPFSILPNTPLNARLPNVTFPFG